MDCLCLLLPFFLSTELDELLTLRKRVVKHEAYIRKIAGQLVHLWEDIKADKQFLSPNGPPNDELVSTCIIIIDLSCCVVVCLEVLQTYMFA